MRLSEYIVGHLRTLLVGKAVQWLIGDWSPRRLRCYLSCLNEWSPRWSRYITFSYITIMMLESHFSRERWYMKHLHEKNVIYEQITRMRNNQPEVVWKVATFGSKSSAICSVPVVEDENKKVHTHTHIHTPHSLKINPFSWLCQHGSFCKGKQSWLLLTN